MENINISIKEGYAEIQIKKNSTLTNKIVDLDDLHTIFKDNVENDTGDLGVFGDGAIGIRRVITRGDKCWVFVNAINPHSAVNFVSNDSISGPEPKYTRGDKVGKTFDDVYFPNLLMGLKLRKEKKVYRVETTFLLSHEGYILDENHDMLSFPFANVHSGDMGRICWGSMSLPELENISQSIGIFQMFLIGEMNRDLFRNDFRGNGKEITSKSSLVDLLRFVNNKGKEIKSFPYSDVKLNKKNTYSNIVAYCKSNLN